MKYILSLVFLFAVAINSACNFRDEKNHAAPLPRSTLTIESEESTVVKINNLDDTSIIIVYHVGSFFSPRPKKIKIDTIKTYFTLADKDTIFSLSKDIISNPINLKGGCTEFVGDLELSIYYGSYKAPGSIRQSIAYSGVCNWNTLSDKTIQLHKILKRKIKGVYLGEHDQNYPGLR